MSGHTDHAEIDYDEKIHETPMAVLIKIDGTGTWIPRSVIVDHDETSNSVIVELWWAEKRG